MASIQQLFRRLLLLLGFKLNKEIKSQLSMTQLTITRALRGRVGSMVSSCSLLEVDLQNHRTSIVHQHPSTTFYLVFFEIRLSHEQFFIDVIEVG